MKSDYTRQFAKTSASIQTSFSSGAHLAERIFLKGGLTKYNGKSPSFIPETQKTNNVYGRCKTQNALTTRIASR